MKLAWCPDHRVEPGEKARTFDHSCRSICTKVRGANG